MYYAKNNIIVPLKGTKSPSYALLNPMSGNFDLLGQKEYELIASGQTEALQPELVNYLEQRGYAFLNREAEKALIQKQWELFQEEIDNTQTQLLLIPSYGCNIACRYCYQAGIQVEHGLITPEVVDAFFIYAGTAFGDRKVKPFITLFGGEPLINSAAHRKIIEMIVDRCVEEGYELAVVTNGYDLVDYVDLLSRARVKEIQVTLDGTKEVHDQRRGTANGQGTFERIVLGVEAALSRGIPINLRTVVDRENLPDLVRLAEFFEGKGWLDLPPQLFKTQVGRNYELFECYAKPQHLLSQAGLWREFSLLSQKHPVLKKFHRPDFKGIRHLVDTGEMYMASFDTCPAAKTEWVFDLNGDIFGCTASCGREEYKLGTFYPEVALKTNDIEQWQRRNVNNIEECRECKYSVICGGGCGVMAANQNGRILSPDCRPIQEIMEIGIDYYRKEIMDMAEVEHDTGCLVCGAELVYKATAEPVICQYCGITEESVVTCLNGHYVCDICHSQDILKSVENYCLQSESTDPMEILNGIFGIPGLKMHGPEYHSIVPAAIVSAYANIASVDKAPLVKEAIKRGREIKGGSCGLHGMCGAAGGAGIAYSIIKRVSPMSREERGNAMRVTATVLNEIGSYGGPRCCKRESVLAVETARGFFSELEEQASAKYQCSQFTKNPDCIKKDCPYFPKRRAQVL